MTKNGNSPTRDLIKAVARRLFVERGIENVSIRDILKAAEQKNVGAIGYYFQTKDALVEEILVDGAREIDNRRNALLDEFEAGHDVVTLHSIMRIIVTSSLDKPCIEGQTTLRFFSVFQARDTATFLRAIANQHDSGFRRCVDYIRQLAPHMPRPILNQRITFMMLMIGTNLSMYEASRDIVNPQDKDIYGGSMWRSDDVLDNLIDSSVGLFEQGVTYLAEKHPKQGIR